mmetsp:Transcript_51023/g.114849  ORF Transcript_51023/g.114849 Transcript_51023/m.114849 type:complete len:846 (+) Transcript_51023:77-2614(+)
MATQVSIFFGSQSGTAQCFAEELQEACDGQGIEAEVIDLKKFDPQDFASRKIVILVVSTWGEGEAPDNAVVFHSWASHPCNNGALVGQRYCVMGLGDMNYAHFNNMGVMTDTNLDRLGSKRIYRRGIGDDCQDIHEHFEQWMDEGLWPALKEAIAAVKLEGGFGAAPLARSMGKDERDYHIFFGVEESGGACQDICDAFTAKLRDSGLSVKTMQSLSDRKAVEVLRKLPSQSVVVSLVDASPDGLCAPGRKIVRNMNLELDAKSLVDKEYLFANIYVAACGGHEKQCQESILKHGQTLTKAYERVGATACSSLESLVVDAASDDAIAKFLDEASAALLKVKEAPSSRKAAPPPAQATAAPAVVTPAAPAASPVRILSADTPQAPVKAVLSKAPVLQMAASASQLPAEADGEPADVLASFYFEATKAKVMKVHELRQQPDADQGLSTVEVEVEATGESLSSYALGGTLSVLPENDPADVNAMLPILGLSLSDLNKVITFVPENGANKVKKPFPTPCTVAEALGKYCDLGKAPTKRMLQLLQPKLKDEAAREQLQKLLEDSDLLKRVLASPLCCRMHEFWQMLDIKGLDLGTFLLLCPRQKVREFTIASSPKATPSQLSICVSLSSHEMPDISPLYKELEERGVAKAPLPSSRTRFFGMCSRWITTRLKAGDTILAKHHTSAFHLPEKDVPVLMVGSGAGVAPFRGFWEELKRGSQAAPSALFFGCRHADQDWLYKDEMLAAVKLASSGCAALARVKVGPKRPLQSLFTAFSRPSDGKEGQYVQDQVRAQATSVRHWMEKMDGHFFICGSSAMGNGVLDALASIVEGGRAQVDAWRKEGRIIAEMWG